MFKQIWIGLSLLILLSTISGKVAAQEGLAHWLRYDVNLNLQQNSGLGVEEVHQVALLNNATIFRHTIPTDRFNSILNFRALEIAPNGVRRDYQQADTGADYTFKLLTEPGQQVVELYFPPNTTSSTTFVFQYFVDGALRFYPEGDQFDWRPFGWEAAAPINSATITLNLPPGFAQEQLKQSSAGVPAEKFIPEPNKAIFTANTIAAGDTLEISLAMPHGVIQGGVSPWQREADLLQFWSPILRWGAIILSILLLLVGLLGVYAWWYFRLRISLPASKKLLRHIKAPPDDLSPAKAGLLLDGKAAPRHLLAILLDLAARGVLHVYYTEQKNEENPDEPAQLTFDLYGLDQEKASKPYEATLYGKIFGYLGARKREMHKVRGLLYVATPEIKNQLELEIAKAGYFSENTRTLHRQYAAFGGAGVMMSFVLGLLTVVILGKFTYMVITPFISLALIAGAFGIIGFAAPKRTKVGQKEAIRWQAFKRYLETLDTAGAAKLKDNFINLLPYAVSFGLEKKFIEHFAAANTPIPAWWNIPEEKLPDISHEKAYAWVSTSFMDETPPASSEKTRTKSVIRRLGTPKTTPTLLKEIQPIFAAFLKQSYEVFSQAPPLTEAEESDIDPLGQTQPNL